MEKLGLGFSALFKASFSCMLITSMYIIIMMSLKVGCRVLTKNIVQIVELTVNLIQNIIEDHRVEYITHFHTLY